VVVVGFTAGFGTIPFFSLGPITFYQEGFNLGLAAAARVICDMSWIAAVFLTTPFNALLKALKWFRVPDVFLESVVPASFAEHSQNPCPGCLEGL
jgi:energy-coupling factor transporter transmembrane protein EcfT